MIKYKFSWLNNGLEITDPTITVNVDGLKLYPTKMEIAVEVIMTTQNAKFGVWLENIKVNNLTFNSGELMQRVLTRLDDFKV